MRVQGPRRQRHRDLARPAGLQQRPPPLGRSVLIGELTRAAVVAYLDALNSHDADRIAACVAENFVNEHTSSMGHSRFGRVEYRAALIGFLADFAELRYEVEELLVDGERAVAAYRMSFQMVSADRAPVSVRGVFRFRVDSDGLIAHRVDYWDSGEVRRQLPGG